MSPRAKRAERPRRVIQPDQRGHGGARQRPPLDLPELIVPTDTPLDEHAVTLAQAAELTGTSFQNWHQRVETRSVPAYLHEGQKYILLEDLATSHAGRVQAAQAADEHWRLAWRKVHVAEPGECQGRGCAHWTHEADDPPAKRPVSAERRIQLARARAIKIQGDERRQLARAADIAEQRAKLAAEESAHMSALPGARQACDASPYC